MVDVVVAVVIGIVVAVVVVVAIVVASSIVIKDTVYIFYAKQLERSYQLAAPPATCATRAFLSFFCITSLCLAAFSLLVTGGHLVCRDQPVPSFSGAIVLAWQKHCYFASWCFHAYFPLFMPQCKTPVDCLERDETTHILAPYATSFFLFDQRLTLMGLIRFLLQGAV